MLRKISAVLCGALFGFILVFLVEMAGHQIWPRPAGLSSVDLENVRAAMAGMPMGALLVVAAAWVIAAFGGGWLAAWIARERWPAYVVGALIALSGIANMLMMPHPFWFWIVALVLVPLAAHFAAVLASQQSRAPRSGAV